MVFVKKEKAKPKDLTIAAMQGRKVKQGQVGIEIEFESSVPGSLPKGTATIADYWSYVPDGSLRGADNAEYVLKKPVPFTDVPDAVDKLWSAFKDKKVKLSDSVRTSTHVHLNVGPFYQNRLAALLGLWFIFEEPLSYWCGDHRAGNLFCIRAKDGESIIRQIKGWLENKGNFTLNNEALHYSALNMGAIAKYSSIEFRTMRGPTEPECVKQWVRILKKLYDASEQFQDPRTLIEKFSLAGPMDFFVQIFSEEAAGLLRDMGNLDVRDSLFEGMRFAQEIIYARDWSDFNPVKVGVDPFMRQQPQETVRVAGRPGEDFPPEWDGQPEVGIEPDPPRQRRVATDWMRNQVEMQRIIIDPFERRNRLNAER